MATAKQLAALKKARAARKRNLRAKNAKKTSATRRTRKKVTRSVKKVARKPVRKHSRKSTAQYVIFLSKVNRDGKLYGKRYFYSAKTEGWDTLLKYATYHSKTVAERVAKTHAKKALSVLPYGWGVAIEKK